MLLYLHGFRSSPQSFKARLLGERMLSLGRSDEYLCPQLPPSPRLAMALILRLLERADRTTLTLVGSSLGGYYATYLAERLDCRAVLLNPALRAFEKLRAHVGPQSAYHDGGDSFEFVPEYLDELERLHVPAISRPARYMLVAATGDEVLDWREMVAGYPRAKQLVIEGSDHGIAEFSRYLNDVIEFADTNQSA